MGNCSGALDCGLSDEQTQNGVCGCAHPSAPCAKALGFTNSSFGPDAEDVLEDDATTYVRVQSQRMLQRFGQIVNAEEKDTKLAKSYYAVLQQVLELIIAAVCDVSGGHLVIAVLSEADFQELEVRHVDNGLLSDILQSTNIYDKVFQKRVWFYKSWVRQFNLPVQGGFAIDYCSGNVLAAAVNFMDETTPMTPLELAGMLQRGVVFGRTEQCGVRVYPATEVSVGQAYQVDDEMALRAA